MKVLPVIHHKDRYTSLEQADIAFDAGADGVFLISHHGEDDALLTVASEMKSRYREKMVGVNLLSRDIKVASRNVASAGLDMVWGDVCGVNSSGLDDTGQWLSQFQKAHSHIKIFASVAFKYQPMEVDPARAAKNALEAGFIPTTSGNATGVAAPLEKIAAMSIGTRGMLAIASGMSVDNIAEYAPYLAFVLVATGVSSDDYHLDFETLYRFISLAKNNATHGVGSV